jgi:hypothetical protein
MSSTISETLITTQSGGSIHSGTINHHITISSTIQYFYENLGTHRQFALTFPLVVNCDSTCQVPTVIGFLPHHIWKHYLTSNDPDTLFSFDNGEIQIGRDAVLLRWPDGWMWQFQINGLEGLPT